jgi:tetratricopeptide (TPR) repeat protein
MTYLSHDRLANRNSHRVNAGKHKKIGMVVDSIERIRLEGNTLFKENNIRAAIEKYSEGISLKTDDVLLYSNRSAARLIFNDFDGSLDDAEKCLTLAPKWSKSYLRKINALRAQKRLGEIPKLCKEAITNCEINDHQTFISIIGECELETFKDRLDGVWKGKVADEMGGYYQTMTFSVDNTMKIEVFGQTQTCSYSLDISRQPILLTIQFGADGSIAKVPYIIELRDSGLSLGMCCPFLVPDLPEKFEGPGFVLMNRLDGTQEMDDDIKIRKERVSQILDSNQRLLSYLSDFTEIISRLPSNDPLNIETPLDDAEIEANKKVIEIMSIHAKVSELEIIYGKELVKSSFGVIAGGDDFESSTASIKQAAIRLKDLLLTAGFLTHEGLEQARIQYSKPKVDETEGFRQKSKLQRKLLEKKESKQQDSVREISPESTLSSSRDVETASADTTIDAKNQTVDEKTISCYFKWALAVCSMGVITYLVSSRISRT